MSAPSLTSPVVIEQIPAQCGKGHPSMNAVMLLSMLKRKKGKRVINQHAMEILLCKDVGTHIMDN